MKVVLSAVTLLALSACSTLPTGSGESSEAALKILSNLEHCDRQYTAALGALGAGGSLSITCKARPFGQ